MGLSVPSTNTGTNTNVEQKPEAPATNTSGGFASQFKTDGQKQAAPGSIQALKAQEEAAKQATAVAAGYKKQDAMSEAEKTSAAIDDTVTGLAAIPERKRKNPLGGLGKILGDKLPGELGAILGGRQPKPLDMEKIFKQLGKERKEEKREYTWPGGAIDKATTMKILSDSNTLLTQQYIRTASEQVNGKPVAPDQITPSTTALGNASQALKTGAVGILTSISTQQPISGSVVSGLVRNVAELIELQGKSGAAVPELKLTDQDIQKLTANLVEVKDGKFVAKKELQERMNGSIAAAGTFTPLLDAINKSEGPMRNAALLRLYAASME